MQCYCGYIALWIRIIGGVIWHSWGMLKTHERWHLDMSWYAILRTLYLYDVITLACSKGVRTLSFLSVLPNHSYQIVHPRWHTPFRSALQTLGLFFDQKSGWHLGSKPDFIADCSRWIYPVGIGQQNGGTTAGLSCIYDNSTVIRFPRSGAEYGVGCSHQNPHQTIGWRTGVCHGIHHLHHRRSWSFWGPTTLCVGPNNESSYHGVDCCFMSFIIKALWWPVVVSGGRGLWSGPQGAQRSTPIEEGMHAMVGEAERISQFKQHVMDKLRAQYFYTTSASSPPVVASSSHIGGTGGSLC